MADAAITNGQRSRIISIYSCFRFCMRLCPGGVDTDLIKGSYLGERLKGQPMINPDDIAQMVLLLLRQPGNIDVPEVIIRRFDPNLK